MSTLTQAQRDKLPASAFCGPNRTFPIVDASDVKDAASLIGKASNSAAVKACIIGKAKRNGWPLPDAWKSSESSRTVHPASVEFALSESAGGDDEYVLRRGKVFECGDYPERNFSLTPEEAYVACAEFQPFPIDLGHPHAPSPLDGQLGTVEIFELGADGKSLHAGARIPRWLDRRIEAAGMGFPASMKWNPLTKTPVALSIVTEGYIPDAALFAAYAEFAGARNSASDQKMIQQAHDHMVSLGATCDPRNAQFAAEPVKEKRKMGLWESIKQAFVDNGVALADEPATPVTPAPAPATPPAESPELATLKAEFAAERDKRIDAEAVAFAASEIAANRALPNEEAHLVKSYRNAVQFDAMRGATFSAENPESAVATLKAAQAARQPHELTKELLSGNAAIFGATEKTDDPSKPKPASPERVKDLIALTPQGQAILNGRNKN